MFYSGYDLACRRVSSATAIAQRSRESRLVQRGIFGVGSCFSIEQGDNRGNLLLGVVLLLLYIVPGLVYFLCRSGYRYRCAECGEAFYCDVIRIGI
jgi:hypothetical protein